MTESLMRGGPGGIKPYDSTNRTLHMIYPSVTRAGPWQYAGVSFDASMAKAKQRVRLEKGWDFGKPLQQQKFHRLLLSQCMAHPVKCRTLFQFKNRIGPFNDEYDDSIWRAGMKSGFDGSNENEAPKTFDLYSPFIGFDNCYDSSGQLNKADKRYLTPIKRNLSELESQQHFKRAHPSHVNPLWSEEDM